MGYNTGILILNDAIHQLDNPDVLKDWWKQVKMSLCGVRCEEPIPITVGNHAGGSKIFHMSHADHGIVYLVGSNTARRLADLGYCFNEDSWPDGKVECLKRIADEMGYKVVRKPVKKSKKKVVKKRT